MPNWSQFETLASGPAFRWWPRKGCGKGGWCVILWPWSCCSCKAWWIFVGGLAPWSFINVQLWSQVQSGWWSLILFSVSVNPLISGNNLFTNRAAAKGWVTSFFVWNPESFRKRASKWPLKSATGSSFFLFSCLYNRQTSAGREVSRNGLYKFSCYFVSFFLAPEMLKIKGFAILLPASILSFTRS